MGVDQPWQHRRTARIDDGGACRSLCAAGVGHAVESVPTNDDDLVVPNRIRLAVNQRPRPNHHELPKRRNAALLLRSPGTSKKRKNHSPAKNSHASSPPRSARLYASSGPEKSGTRVSARSEEHTSELQHT